MHFPIDRHEQSTMLSDLSIYGDHGPHLRYRQEQMRAMIRLAKDSPAAHDPRMPRLTIRERIGSRLIAWGKRLEGCPNPTIAHTA